MVCVWIRKKIAFIVGRVERRVRKEKSVTQERVLFSARKGWTSAGRFALSSSRIGRTVGRVGRLARAAKCVPTVCARCLARERRWNVAVGAQIGKATTTTVVLVGRAALVESAVLRGLALVRAGKAIVAGRALIRCRIGSVVGLAIRCVRQGKCARQGLVWCLARGRRSNVAELALMRRIATRTVEVVERAVWGG